jgi:peptidoglycan/LPS O-acetylase OafA/YrhL
MTQRQWVTAVLLGLIVTALFWIDPLFVPLALLGPLLVGAIAGVRGEPWLWVAVLWIVAGLGAVVSDFVINQEDVGFHIVLTVIMVGLALLAWWAGRAVRSRREVAT